MLRIFALQRANQRFGRARFSHRYRVHPESTVAPRLYRKLPKTLGHMLKIPRLPPARATIDAAAREAAARRAIACRQKRCALMAQGLRWAVITCCARTARGPMPPRLSAREHP